MTINQIIQSQYLASLKMLKLAVIACPNSTWDSMKDKNKFWHIAYHALFYLHLYLKPTREEFTPWIKHREGYNNLGSLPRSPDKPPDISEPYSKDEILEYLEFCEVELKRLIPSLDLETDSGFSWLKFGKLELQFYNIRHIQQHVGELCERLGERAGIDVDWVGNVEFDIG
jgi:hypothetical protein